MSAERISQSEVFGELAKYLIEGQVVFDNHLMTLSRGKDVTTLVVNEAELLGMLMEGSATKLAVIDQVWESKGMYVTEGSYHQLVRSLRVKLEEQGIAGSMIRTLPRLGLKFLGEMEPLADAPAVAAPAAPAAPDAAAPQAPEPVLVEQPEAAVVLAADGTGEAAADGEITADTAGAGGGAERVSGAAPEATPAPKGIAGSPAPAMPAAAQSEAFAGRGAARHGKAHYVIYAVLVAWAAVLVWKTFFPRDNRYQFRFEKTEDGIHYFSNGRMEQTKLLSSLGVTAPAGGYVYQIVAGPNDWLAVCPKSIYSAPELCESYFIERTY